MKTPLPLNLKSIPRGYVYLGKGGEFNTDGKEFRGYGRSKDGDFSGGPQGFPLNGRGPNYYYFAPVGSEIARLNGIMPRKRKPAKYVISAGRCPWLSAAYLKVEGEKVTLVDRGGRARPYLDGDVEREIGRGNWTYTDKKTALARVDQRPAPAPKPVPVVPPKPAYRYAFNPTGGFIEKFNENFYQVIYPKGFKRAQVRADLLSTIESAIKDGRMIELTHAEFLTKINSWGLKEDGTKIPPVPVPPPKTTAADLWDAFKAYTKQSGKGMHNLKLFDDESGGIHDIRDKKLFSFGYPNGFTGAVAWLKANTK